MAQRVGLSIKDAMPPAAQVFARKQPLAVVALIDKDDNVWASLLVGTPGFMEPLDGRTLRVDATPFVGDPLAANLHTHSAVGLLLIVVQAGA